MRTARILWHNVYNKNARTDFYFPTELIDLLNKTMISKMLVCIFVSLLAMTPLQESALETSPAETPKVDAPTKTTQEVREVDQSDPLDNPTEPRPVPIVDKEQQSIEIADSWKRLGANQIWINEADKQVMVRGSICLTKGALEMFACPLQTKEHESVVAVEAKSSEIHACLVALGFEPGNPVQWQPDYRPAKGPSIQIEVRWKTDDEKEKTVDAKTLVRTSGTKETLDTDWVFGGSEIFVDRVDGRRIYYADSGEMICLSNFPTAMMDVPIKSSDSAEGLLFEANTKMIPPQGTQVYLIMTPRN